MAAANAELVFSGKVVSVTRTAPGGNRATFDVHRVWKGEVAARFDACVWETAPQSPKFQRDSDYIVVASRINNPEKRAAVGLRDGAATAFAAFGCRGLDPSIREQLGPNHPPEMQ